MCLKEALGETASLLWLRSSSFTESKSSNMFGGIPAKSRGVGIEELGDQFKVVFVE
jgi:hypothetical protein